MADTLAPLLVGVGVSGAIHATHRYITSMPDSDVILKLDFAKRSTHYLATVYWKMSRDVSEI